MKLKAKVQNCQIYINIKTKYLTCYYVTQIQVSPHPSLHSPSFISYHFPLISPRLPHPTLFPVFPYSLHLSLSISLFLSSLSLSLTIPLYTWYCPSLSPQHSSAAKRPHRGYPRGSSEPILKFVRFFAIQCIVDA